VLGAREALATGCADSSGADPGKTSAEEPFDDELVSSVESRGAGWPATGAVAKELVRTGSGFFGGSITLAPVGSAQVRRGIGGRSGFR
jgi:hypothetical protein